MHPLQGFSTIAKEWPVLLSDEVHVWRADLLISESQIASLHSLLSEDERQRADRFYFSEHRSLFIVRHGILRSILSHYVALPPDQLQFVYNAYGKPELKNQDKHGICFSLSQTNRWAIYSVTLLRKIGIDIEQIRSDFDFLTLAKNFFAAGEIQALSSFPPDQQPDAFFRCWTRKEAYVKAIGQGLSLSLSSFEVSLNREERTPIQTFQKTEDWFAFSLYPFPNTIAALAVKGNPRIKFFTFMQPPDEGISEKIEPLVVSYKAEPQHLTDEQKQRALVQWNDTRKEYPRDKCIHELFEDQTARTPDAIALVSSVEIVTYEQLNHRANRLAHTLQSLGVRPESRVGLFAHRSIATIMGMLAILKAGGVYVPLDPEYPEERLDFLLKDTDPVVLLVDRDQKGRLPKHNTKVLFLDEAGVQSEEEIKSNPVSEATAENLCYIMYTSGSTGQPKGVCIPHRGVVRLVKNTNYVHFAPEDTFLQLSPLSFDVSTFEIWGSLLNGARLVIPPAGRLSTQEIGDVLLKYHVTTLWLTSWLFHEMVDSNLKGLKGVQQLLAGGDVLSVSHVKRVLNELTDCQLINGYGPTENTTFSCCYSVGSSDAIGKTVPIGQPISNSTIYILDDCLKPVGIGETGEIYMGGDGLARGYLKRPELTAERFIPNPFIEDGSSLYRSGDLGRWLPEGIIEFLGRMDDQVKIRGFRVEPGEIETVLTGHPAIRQAVVVSSRNEQGENRLIAYLLRRQNSFKQRSELQEFLKQKLPHYMMPSEFVFLDAFPLTPNGKIDRRALPEPSYRRESARPNFVPPRTKVEEDVQAIWVEVLEKVEISMDDDFFEIGGDSLSATRVISRIRSRFNIDLPLRVLFEQSTIASLARAIQEQQTV